MRMKRLTGCQPNALFQPITRGIARAMYTSVAEQMEMWTKNSARSGPETEGLLVYIVMALMWAVFFFAFYLLWQKAAM